MYKRQDDAAFAGQLAEKIEAIVKPQMPRSTVDCATDAALLRALPLAKYDLAFWDIDMGPLNGVDLDVYKRQALDFPRGTSI